MTNAAPLLPGINVVLAIPTLELHNLLIQAIEAGSNGAIKPALKSDSASALRAHYPPAISQIIINTPDHEMCARVGNPSAAVAVIVKGDRVGAAKRMAKVFTDAGHEAIVHTQAEPEFPDGLVIFVSVPDLKGIVLMVWPDREDLTPEILAQIPAREPWTEKDLNRKA